MTHIPSRYLSRALLILAITAMSAGPAYAISAKYRAQLEASGCTQMTDGMTCDIHKTKAQNTLRQTQSEEIDAMIGQPISDIAEHLLAEGWKPQNGRWYQGDRVLTLTVVDEVVKHARLAQRNDR